MSEQSVRIERDGGLAVLTLDRPAAYNAIDIGLGEALLDVLVACDEDDGVRAVMITGAGPAFCAGGDIRAMEASSREPGGAAAFLKRLTVYLHGAVATLVRMPKPVVAAVNGAAAGAGFSLALACDLIVAVENARFTLAYAGIGLPPDGSSTFFLPRLVGPKRAFELMSSNRSLSAEEAHALGLVNEVYGADGFHDRARAFAARLADGPTRALGHAKRLIALGAECGLEGQMEHERQAIAACGRTSDFEEGRRAFLGKRAPVFEGR